ncbi:unnamed protein product [Cylicocyclus nassatus]|uniref:LIM zinc-binding domain-containing protein n=1 Tax=Cylicocyclus nassatus TaxID=53992 RepID=A0AA36H1A7_CYLNA|nr:unnamed protein product [Cylicocyclus nassatus]
MGTKHIEHNGKAYCESDYVELFGEFCCQCSCVLSKESINVMGKKWCIDCYRCVACDRILKCRDKVLNFDMRPMCKKCYRRKDFRKHLKEGPHI